MVTGTFPVATIDAPKAGPSAGAAPPDWNSAWKSAGKNDAVDGSAAGVPQAVREGSPFAPGGSVGAAVSSGGDGEEGLTLHNRVYAVGQVLGAFVGGFGLGVVPGGAVAQQAAVALGGLERGTKSAQIGLAVGEIFGGGLLAAGGVTGEVVGVVSSLTGIGAIVGVPAIAISTTALVGATANVGAGAGGSRRR